MAAPLGFKTFTTGEVLTAADTNGYLMQGVLVFADAAARSAAIASPEEGQTSYLKDTDEIQVYSGSAWVTKSGSLPSQTGNSGKYLTTDGTNTSWGTVAAGGMTSIASGTLSGASVVISSIAGTYKDLVLVVRQRLQATANQAAGIRLNGDSGNNYYNSNIYYNDTSAGIGTPAINFIRVGGDVATSGTSRGLEIIRIYDYANSSTFKICDVNSFTTNSTPSIKNQIGYYASASAITSVTICAESGNLTSGSYVLYGVS